MFLSFAYAQFCASRAFDLALPSKLWSLAVGGYAFFQRAYPR